MKVEKVSASRDEKRHRRKRGVHKSRESRSIFTERNEKFIGRGRRERDRKASAEEKHANSIAKWSEGISSLSRQGEKFIR